jgi:hypothetical protein
MTEIAFDAELYEDAMELPILKTGKAVEYGDGLIVVNSLVSAAAVCIVSRPAVVHVWVRTCVISTGGAYRCLPTVGCRLPSPTRRRSVASSQWT